MNENITYGHVTLRALEPDDIDLLYAWENNTHIWQVSNTRAPFSRHILAIYIKDSAGDIYESKQLRLIIGNETGKPVGSIDLFDIDPYHQRAGIGILIHNTEERRRGYASDALAAICQYCLNFIGLRQLYANIQESNVASIELFKKAGFQISGIKKQWLRTLSGWENELLMQKFLTE